MRQRVEPANTRAIFLAQDIIPVHHRASRISPSTYTTMRLNMQECSQLSFTENQSQNQSIQRSQVLIPTFITGRDRSLMSSQSDRGLAGPRPPPSRRIDPSLVNPSLRPKPPRKTPFEKASLQVTLSSIGILLSCPSSYSEVSSMPIPSASGSMIGRSFIMVPPLPWLTWRVSFGFCSSSLRGR